MDKVLSVLQVGFNLLEVIFLFNLLIVVHELGHFLAARWRGLVVEQFGIWFGKPIWQKRINGVVYSLGSIPAGGFVKLPQMAPMDVIEGKTETPREQLPQASVLDRIIVAFAGPLFSLLLAFVFAVIVWQVGRPTTESEATTTIGLVENGSPAEEAGLKPGDRIVSIDGKPIKRFQGQVDSVTWGVIRSEGDKIHFQVEREVNGTKQMVDIYSGFRRQETGRFARAGLREVGIAPRSPAVIEAVAPSTPAAQAGLQPKDVITHVNGEAVFNPAAVAIAIHEDPKRPVKLQVSRGSENLPFEIQPVLMDTDGAQVPRIGIQWWMGDVMYVYPGPIEQVWQSMQTIRNMLGALFSPKSDVKAQHFSGPVGIGHLYYRLLTSEEGWRLALWFSVLFNVNLAVLNMLPIPVLDGGHITMAIIEGIRKKPVSVKVQETLTTACAMLLFGFMFYVTFFDIQDLPWNWGAKSTPTPTPTPAATATP